ncbi:hypothetical protein SDC9_210979 [bioreactor metagenome]|jgi:hypothetical protein|uniref:Uncharacterized protein n=1 Tax=bioreactor metagenome TaxID=1076179 RepID=A0A645JJ25_9ZZZZ
MAHSGLLFLKLSGQRKLNLRVYDTSHFIVNHVKIIEHFTELLDLSIISIYFYFETYRAHQDTKSCHPLPNGADDSFFDID